MKAPEQGRILDSQCIYDGKIVRLEVDQLEFGGRATIREVVRHPGGVVLLGIRDDGLIPFVRQLRYPMQEEILELPAGKLDPGEDPREAAAREMEEETGINDYIEVLENIHYFEFEANGGYGWMKEYVYGVQVQEGVQVVISDEHTEMKWCSLEEACHLLKYDSNKEGLRKIAAEA